MSREDKRFYEKYPVQHQYWFRGKIYKAHECDPVYLKALRYAHVRDTDVLIATYPKSGTTWISEIVSTILEEGNVDSVKEVPLAERVYHLEILKSVEVLDNWSRDKPRVFFTHLVWDWLPEQVTQGKGKVISVWRNPKDVAVSFYHYYQSVSWANYYNGSWEEFLDAFLKGWLVQGSIFDYAKSWRLALQSDNVLVVTYEDLITDLFSSLKKIATFLGKNFDETTLRNIVDHVSFSNMKSNIMVNWFEKNELFERESNGCPFFRKGVTGD